MSVATGYVPLLPLQYLQLLVCHGDKLPVPWPSAAFCPVECPWAGDGVYAGDGGFGEGAALPGEAEGAFPVAGAAGSFAAPLFGSDLEPKELAEHLRHFSEHKCFVISPAIPVRMGDQTADLFPIPLLEGVQQAALMEGHLPMRLPKPRQPETAGEQRAESGLEKMAWNRKGRYQ